jgi:DNA-binding CsgD family transcriptional regulator
MNEQAALLEHESQIFADGLETGADKSATADKFLENALVFNAGGDVMLTKREGEILRLIIGGHTNKQIARRLSRSERTVEYHRNRLMRKIGAHNAAELVRHSLVMGVV